MIGCCEGEVRDCCLKSYWVIYFSNMLWDHIPDAMLLTKIMACLIILRCSRVGHPRVAIRSVLIV